MSGRLEIRTLGGLSIRLNETAVANFASRKADALLIYLACNPRPHPRETLATMFWDDSPQQRSLANLSVLLTSLRKQLAPFLLSSRHEVQLNPEAEIWLDTAVLTNALQQQTELTRSTAAAAAQAIALYRGPFLSGFHIPQASDFSEWVLLEQERLQQLAIVGMDQLVTFYQQRAQFTEGIALCMKLINLDPLREESHRQMIQLYALSGERNAALEQYQTCATILEDELGVEPDEETTALVEAVREGSLVEGERPLTTRPSSKTPRHNLPAEMTSFVGRDDELAQIESRLAQPKCRLLTLMGPGGVGKTRLMLAAARQQLNQYLDGVWLVPLASLPTADFLETAVAEAIGFTFSETEDSRQQLLNFLSQKEMLLLLDNFEHLLDSPGITLLTDILRRAPEVQLLVSSRERLNIQAEWLLEVGGLPYPNTTEKGQPEQFGGVQLFVQRAQQLSPTFEVTAEALTYSANIVRLVAGMPLAIELAAANVRYYALDDIAAGIQEGLDLLQTSLRDLPERHRSVRAVMDRSWETLTEAEQTGLMGASVFRGAFSQTAGLAVLKTSPHVLHDLVDKSLLERLGNGRFRLHNIIRHYAAEKLSQKADLEKRMRGRHGNFYSSLLAQSRSSLKGGRQLDALDAIQADIENIRAGWRYAQELDPQTPTLIPMLADALDALFHFYLMRSWLREGLSLFGEGVAWLANSKSEAEVELRERLRSRYGWFAFLLGQREEGAAALRRSLSTLTNSDQYEDIIFCHNYLGAVAFYEQMIELAADHLDEAMHLAKEHADVYGEAIALNISGLRYLALDALEEAEGAFKQSFRLKRQIEDLWGCAFSLEKLGQVALLKGNGKAAEQHLQESMDIRQRLNDRRGVAHCLHQLGDLAQLREDEQTAVTLYNDSLTHFQAIGDAQAVAAVQDKLDNYD